MRLLYLLLLWSYSLVAFVCADQRTVQEQEVGALVPTKLKKRVSDKMQLVVSHVLFEDDEKTFYAAALLRSANDEAGRDRITPLFLCVPGKKIQIPARVKFVKKGTFLRVAQHTLSSELFESLFKCSNFCKNNSRANWRMCLKRYLFSSPRGDLIAWTERKLKRIPNSISSGYFSDDEREDVVLKAVS